MFSVLSNYTYMFPVVSIKSRLLKHSDCPPMTFIYGNDPSFTTIGGKMLQEVMEDKVTVEEIANASHHVQAENPEEFHRVMTEVFHKADTVQVTDERTDTSGPQL